MKKNQSGGTGEPDRIFVGIFSEVSRIGRDRDFKTLPETNLFIFHRISQVLVHFWRIRFSIELETDIINKDENILPIRLFKLAFMSN